GVGGATAGVGAETDRGRGTRRAGRTREAIVGRTPSFDRQPAAGSAARPKRAFSGSAGTRDAGGRGRGRVGEGTETTPGRPRAARSHSGNAGAAAKTTADDRPRS